LQIIPFFLRKHMTMHCIVNRTNFVQHQYQTHAHAFLNSAWPQKFWIINEVKVQFAIFRCFHVFEKSDYQLPHACLSIRMEQICSYWTDFHEIL
jgi:hypothetical protein